MKTAILFYSKHHGNTRKLVDAIKAADDSVTLIDITNSDSSDLSDFDLIGIASGIYAANFSDEIRSYTERYLPNGKKVFFLFTSSMNLPSFTKLPAEGFIHIRIFPDAMMHVDRPQLIPQLILQVFERGKERNGVTSARQGQQQRQRFAFLHDLAKEGLHLFLQCRRLSISLLFVSQSAFHRSSCIWVAILYGLWVQKTGRSQP